MAGYGVDTQLTLKDHHAARMKECRKAMARLRWLTV